VFAARRAVDLFRALPEERALALGARMGATFGGLAPERRRIALTNLRLAFPEWEPARRQQVLRQSLEGLGRGLVESVRLGLLSPDALKERFAVQGWEHFERARSSSPTGGVVVVTAHFGSWEFLASAMIAHGLEVAVAHRQRRIPGIETLVQQLRSAGGAETYARGNAARQALRALRDGKVLALPLDQNTPRRQGVFVPFFGRPASVRSVAVRLAMKSRAPVVPAFSRRQPDGIHHLVHFRPPVELVTEGADEDAIVRENARRMTVPIETEIREAPEQWFWVHKRWRTRPDGWSSLY